MHMNKTAALLGLFGVIVGVGCGDDGDAATGFTTNGETGIPGDGDGDGDPTGDGDGDPTTGDGDGDPTTGDGDGDPTGDGDGDPTTGDGDGDPTTGDGDGDPFVPVPCDVAEANLQPKIPQVMLVLDKSGSMVSNSWDHDQDPNTPVITRWQSLHNVVSFIIGNFDDQMDFGAILFPSAQATNAYGPEACLVNNAPEVPVGVDGQVILQTIPPANAVNLQGGTPGERAVAVAGQHLKSLDPEQPKAIVYISDGAANCSTSAMTNYQLFENYDLNLPVTLAGLWTADGIPTYVVGIDISTQQTSGQQDGNPNNIVPWCKMDQLGELGGKPTDVAPGMACAETATNNRDFYPAANEIQLQAALQAIIEDAISCEIVLDPVPPFPNLLEVQLDGMTVPKVTDCATENGWVYTNAEYTAIELCGTFCADLTVLGSADVLYFCDPG
jgi:hypothetical protein